MTYDFAYDFETLPTFGRVFDFAYDFRLLKIFQPPYDYGWHTRWHTRILDRTGWAARKQDRKPGKPCPSTVPGWLAVSNLPDQARFPVFAVPFYGLVYAVFRACNGAILRFTSLYVS